MKKHLLLLVLAFVTSATLAQNEDLYTITFREKEELNWDVDFMQQRDGDFIVHSFLRDDNGIPWIGTAVGNLFCKVSHTTFDVTDSLFFADTIQNTFVMARDPRGEGNLLGTLEYHEDSDSSFLRISHFPDDELVIDHQQDVLVPMCEGTARLVYHCQLVDSRGDIIVKYGRDRSDGGIDEFLARIDPNGTMKYQTMVTENANDLIYPLRQFKDSPLQYYLWKYTDDDNPHPNLALYVMDSLFHKNTIILNRMLNEVVIDSLSTEYEYLDFGTRSELIPIGGDDVLVADDYRNDTNFLPLRAEYGVAVAKYDIRIMRLKDYVVFNDFPGNQTRGEVMGLKRMTDGTVYLLYRETGYPSESIVVVKMDTDLNVEWKRFCNLWPIHSAAPLHYPVLFEDGQGTEQGIAWQGGGINRKDGNMIWLHFFLYHDGIPASVEDGLVIRPYAYYPNPTRDVLHLQFSPDVTPTQIELYDLQGRLVRSQRNGLETLEMNGLAAGTYTMRVTLENGQVFSDKVVKE